MPSSAAFLNAERSPSSAAAEGKVCSVAPKLCEMTSARWWSTTWFSARTISGKPVIPSVSDTGVTTSSSFAPGAIA